MTGAEAISDIVQRTFTRYFVPGLVFYIVAICLPLFFFLGSSEFAKAELLSGSAILVFSAILGYLLDGTGAYSLHFHAKEYEKEKKELVRELSKISVNYKYKQIIDSKNCDPDQFNAILWMKDNATYERIFVERAEWVAILESASSLLVSVFNLFLVLVLNHLNRSDSLSTDLVLLSLILVLSFTSHRLSLKGIQRMKAHNTKLIYAISEILNK